MCEWDLWTTHRYETLINLVFYLCVFIYSVDKLTKCRQVITTPQQGVAYNFFVRLREPEDGLLHKHTMVIKSICRGILP